MGRTGLNPGSPAGTTLWCQPACLAVISRCPLQTFCLHAQNRGGRREVHGGRVSHPCLIFPKRFPSSPIICLGEQRAHQEGASLQLLAWVQGVLVHHTVVLQQEVIQLTRVPESTPLSVDTHAAFIALHQLHILHLLHVTCIAACTCEEGALRILEAISSPPRSIHTEDTCTGVRGGSGVSCHTITLALSGHALRFSVPKALSGEYSEMSL